MKESQKEFFAARVDPEVLEILKAEAEARGVRVSAIAREAFAEWIAHHIENRCPWCGAVNLPGADWCGSCTAALSPIAMTKMREDLEATIEEARTMLKTVEIQTTIADQQTKLAAAATEALLIQLRARDQDQGEAPTRPRIRGPGQEPLTPEA